MGKFAFGEDDFDLGRKTGKSSAVVEKKEIVQDSEKEVQSDTGNVTVSGLSGTRGRKGQKLPTMNMRFSVENYEYIRREGAVRGLTATAFVNWLIETYRSDPAHVNYTDDFQEKANW